MSFSVDVLANIAIELQRGIGHQDRFQRLITTLRQVLECDASALLRYDSHPDSGLDDLQNKNWFVYSHSHPSHA